MTQRSASLQVKITLRDTHPPVWRRVIVPDDISLGELHVVIQRAMGWADCHLHAFDIGDAHFAVLDPEDPITTLDEWRALLRSAARVGLPFRYTYDFGDEWEHDVVIEQTLRDSGSPPHCVAGRMACPPEDVGGIPGYADFVEAMGDPAHPEHAEHAEWIGRPFDPAAFDMDEVNAGLAAIGRLR